MSKTTKKSPKAASKAAPPAEVIPLAPKPNRFSSLVAEAAITVARCLVNLTKAREKAAETALEESLLGPWAGEATARAAGEIAKAAGELYAAWTVLNRFYFASGREAGADERLESIRKWIFNCIAQLATHGVQASSCHLSSALSVVRSKASAETYIRLLGELERQAELPVLDDSASLPAELNEAVEALVACCESRAELRVSPSVFFSRIQRAS